ncbi:hypothetical protein PHET_01948 [Paragonimus heterotremus]|uniref:Uncharacterized protein n=1 Tax=Paragonimus heterotremus TaxID=100268 RepID=A0A8J4WUB4_9TREM|nr:hypothetical protein PHET_01948 [Paragonimus heterotremus]
MIGPSWFIIFFCILFTDNTRATVNFVYIEPHHRILSQKKHNKVTLCVRHNEQRWCTPEEKQIFANAYCEVISADLGDRPSTAVPRLFTHDIDLRELDPGVYRFICRLGPGQEAVEARRLVLHDDSPRLDCSSGGKFIDSHDRLTERVICCLRTPVRSVWVRQFSRSFQWCLSNLQCTTTARGTSFHSGVLYFTQPDMIEPGNMHVQCGNGLYDEWHYLIDKRAPDLTIRLYPTDWILFSKTGIRLNACLSRKEELQCLPHSEDSQQQILCDISIIRPESGVTVKTYRRASPLEFLPPIIEGQYRMNCIHSETGVQGVLERYVLHQGSFALDCSMAPLRIYTDQSRGEHIFCRWQLKVSRFWMGVFTQMRLPWETFTCSDKEGKLEFRDGMLQLDVNRPIRGLFHISCGNKLVSSRLLITKNYGDLRITLRPSAILINRTVGGILWAELDWRNSSKPDLVELRRHYSVYCTLHTRTSLNQSWLQNFSNYLEIQEMPNGLVYINCECPDLGLRRTFPKYVVGQPVKVGAVISPVLFDWSPDPVARTSEDCLQPSASIEVGNRVLVLSIAEMDISSATKLCLGYEHGKKFYIRDTDLDLFFSPNQPFYTINQTSQVKIYIAASNTTRQQANILKSISLECKVVNPHGIPVHLVTTPGLLMNVSNYVSFNDASELLPSGVYHYRCDYHGGMLSLETSVTLIAQRETSLRIFGMEKRFHLSSHYHTYVCVLIGPTLNAFFTEHYNCSWRSLIHNASAAHEGSNLIIDSRATIGTHNYECSYNKNGLQLKTKLEFYVTNASEMELRLNFRTNRSLVYNPMKEKQIIIECSAGFLGAMTGQRPEWHLITGRQQARAGDRSHYSEAKSVFYIRDMHIGSNSIRCKLSVYSMCLSKLVIFRIVDPKPRVTFMPKTRYFEVGSRVTCVPENQYDNMEPYDTEIRMVFSSDVGMISAGRRSILWTGTTTLNTLSMVTIQCILQMGYLDQIEHVNKQEVIFQVSTVATDLNFMPSTIDLNNEDQFGCFTSSQETTGGPILAFPRDTDHPGLAYLTSNTWQQGEWMDRSSYIYSCILILPNRDPVFIEDSVYVTKNPTKLFFRKLGWSWMEGWKCETDGFPVTSADFNVTILDQPMGSHFDISNDTVIVTQFSIFGRVRLSCVLNYRSKSSFLIKRITEDVIFVDTGHIWDGNVEQFTENTNPVYFILTSVISLLYIIVYRFMWNRVPLASSWLVRLQADLVEYDVDPPFDAHLLITETLLGRNDFAYFCDLIGEFDVTQKMCVLVLQQMKPKRDSIPDAPHPGDLLFKTRSSDVDETETVSEGLSFEETREMFWNRDLTPQQPPVETQSERRSIMITGVERPSVRLSLLVEKNVSDPRNLDTRIRRLSLLTTDGTFFDEPTDDIEMRSTIS